MNGFCSSRNNWLSGLQWFFFIFCNTVVIPPTLQSAFNLSPSATFCITQYTFISTALACLAQVFLGHRRAIMEGPTGLWWVTILTLTLAESANGTPLSEIGGSLAVGILISGMLTMAIGISGLGFRLAILFRPAVMATFMFLLGAQLITIFMKGMLGLPFGLYTGLVTIHYPAFFWALAVLMLIIIIIAFLPPAIGKYALLIGTLVGWGGYSWWFIADAEPIKGADWVLFPLGWPQDLHWGIVISAILTGLVNVSNNFAAIRGTDIFYAGGPAGRRIFRRSFMVSGGLTCLAAPLGVVPFSPFVSSIGLLTQTQDSSRHSFIIGSMIFLVVGMVTPLAQFFCSIPLTVSSAVMLASYLPLLFSSVLFINKIELNSRNIYRLAVPLFLGVFLMSMPSSFWQGVPITIRPLFSNGLLVGVLVAVFVENIIPWDNVK